MTPDPRDTPGYVGRWRTLHIIDDDKARRDRSRPWPTEWATYRRG